VEFQILNPREYPDWDALLLHNNDYEFFHSRAWAMVLEQTYGFKPIYHIWLEGQQLAFMMPMMEVRSLWTGARGVSLPYTDQCPLLGSRSELADDVMSRLVRYGERSRWSSIEWRDGRLFDISLPAWKTYFAHEVNLLRSEADLFAAFGENNRRNIRKAMKDGLIIRIDRSQESFREFVRLNAITRRRHGLPPQPSAFFENVFKYIIGAEKGIIVRAVHGGQVVAASMFFHFGTKALFKYGASEAPHQGLRPNNLILWKALNWYRDRGFSTMSLGRSERTNPGLLRFKRTWGGKEETVKYYRFDFRTNGYSQEQPDHDLLIRRLISKVPIPVLRMAGRFLYRHVG
jgi:hypothetical protein